MLGSMNIIWCPSIDDEMREQMGKFIKNFPNTHPTTLEGGKKQLGAFNPAMDRLRPLRKALFAHDRQA